MNEQSELSLDCFPWGPGFGICQALDNPEVWSFVFSKSTLGPDYSSAREDVKRIVKRLDSTPRSVLTESTESFGLALIDTLRYPAGRRELIELLGRKLTETKPREFLAQHIYAYLMKSGCGWDMTEFCDPKGDKHFLNLSKFRVWLLNKQFNDNEANWIVMMAAAFAILQKEINSEIRNTIHETIPNVSAKLGYSKPVALRNAISRLQPKAGTARPQSICDPSPFDKSTSTDANKHELEPKLSPSDSPVTVDCLPAEQAANFTTLDSFNGTLSALSQQLQKLSESAQAYCLDDFRTAYRELEDFAKRTEEVRDDYQAQLTQFDRDFERVLNLYNEVSQLTSIVSDQSIRGTIVNATNCSLSESSQVLSTLEQILSRIVSQYRQLEELNTRLKFPMPLISLDSIEDLGAVSVGLDKLIGECERRLLEIKRQEVSVVSCLEIVQNAETADFTRAIPHISVEMYEDVLRFLLGQLPQHGPSKAYAELVNRYDLAGLTLGVLINKSQQRAITFLVECVDCIESLSRPDRLKCLQFLNAGQLQDLCAICQNYSPIVAELFFLTALRNVRSDTLEYIEPILNSPGIIKSCKAVYLEFLNAARRGALTQAISSITSVADHAKMEQVRNDSRNAILALITKPPGLKKTYHILRVLAQSLYLTDLQNFIENGEAASAIEKWNSFGGMASMVQSCIRASGKGKEIDASHEEQTLKFLQSFDRLLFTWNASFAVTNWDHNPLAEAMRRLEGESHVAARSLLESICDVNSPVTMELALSMHFCENVRVAEGGDAYLSFPDELVSPTDEISWPSFIDGRAVALECLFFDKLFNALKPSPVRLADSIEHYLSKRYFRAAREGAISNSQLISLVESRIEAERSEFCDRFKVLLEEAETARKLDVYVDIAITEIEQLLKDLEFTAASNQIFELDLLLSDFRAQQDPERKFLVEYLAAAGETVALQESKVQIKARVERLKDAKKYDRLHLLEIEELIKRSAFPALSLSLSKILSDYDHPKHWISSELAFELSSAICDAGKCITNRLKFSTDGFENLDALTQSLCDWLLEQVEACILAGRDSQNTQIELFKNIAAEIATPLVPESYVLRIIGGSRQPSSLAIDREQPPRESSEQPPRRNTVQAMEKPLQVDRNVIRDLRKWLTEKLGQETHICELPANALRLTRSISESDWEMATSVAARLVTQNGEIQDDVSLDATEIAFAIAYSVKYSNIQREEKLSDLRNACLAAVAVAHSSHQHLLPQGTANRFVGWAIAQVITNRTDLLFDKTLPDAISEGIDSLLQSADREVGYRWFSELLIRANSLVSEDVDGSARLADAIWDSLTGVKPDVAPARARLITLLYRCRKFDALRYLIRHASQQRQAEIRACFETLLRVQAEPQLRPIASQRFIALRERSFKQGNTKPWILFLEQALSQSESVERPLECVLESEFLAFDENDNGLIEVVLKPSTLDPPQELQLNLSASAEGTHAVHAITILEPNDMLLSPRVVTVSIPPLLLQDAGDVVRISFHICGTTILNRKVDVRGTWELPNSRQRLAPFEESLLRRSWPGATGDPVQSEMGFYGRSEEIRQIESYLGDPVRPRSVMVVGQRRIGKTSLLLELVKQMPPSERRMCGVYVDVEGLSLPVEGGLMQTALFECIESAIATKDQNLLLRTELEKANGRNRVDKLFRGLKPAVSFADAMEELVKRIDVETRGVVNRVAIFIDEFDRFVEPLLRGRIEEVGRLMWALREIVQRSQRISLVLAGSGLQRVFTGEYENAFYGSIDEVVIGAFDWERDREAIEATLFPPYIRERLCPAERRQVVVMHAYRLCGGHPYYLSMLGYASSRVSRGHPLTPALLNRVVERMIRGKAGGNISSKKFYGHIFESLKRIPIRDQHAARLILVSIAERTTHEFPKLSKSDAIDIPELRELDRSTRFDLLRTLAHEYAIEADDRNGLVGIRVPITAAALREDADRLRQEACLALESLAESQP